MAGRYKKPVQCGRESTHKSRVARGNGMQEDCMRRNQHHLGDAGEHQRWEKSAAVDSAEPNSKEMLPCMRQHFVDARFLSTWDFCRHEYFVITSSILLTRVFCRRQHYVDANILLRRTFLLLPIFCRRQCFVSANILSVPIFCLCLGLRMIIINDCVLCISWLLLICLTPFRFQPLISCWPLLQSQ